MKTQSKNCFHVLVLVILPNSYKHMHAVCVIQTTPIHENFNFMSHPHIFIIYNVGVERKLMENAKRCVTSCQVTAHAAVSMR